MKKIGKLFAVLLTAAMLLSLLSVMAAAASSPTFRVYCELDKTSYAVNDTVTAKIYVQRTDASDDYALYNFTDRVVFYTVLLAYESGETGPADFRLDSGSNGNGTYWNERCSYISIRYQYLASGTPDNRAATLLAATLRFKVKANCQTTLGHDHVQVWTTPSGTAGETAASESATITAGTPKYCSLTFSGGSGATGSAAGMSRIPSGSYVTLPSNSFAKTGKTFGGWYDGKSICPAGTNYYVTSDTAFTAVWKPAVITYSGGSGGDVLCVNPSNTRVLTGDTAEVGTVLTFTATAANGYKFAGWSDGSSENPRTVTVIGDVNLTARFTASGGTGNTVNTGDNGNTGSTGASGSVPVVVDGTEYGIGSSAVSGGTTVVTVDQTALENQLQTASSTVVVPISADTSAVEAKLVVENIETMADKNMTLSVQTGNVTYEVPAAAVDTAELMKALNAADPAAVPVTVTIQQLDSSNVTVSGGTLLMAPVSFTVTASYGGQTYTVSTFTKYVARVITVPSGVDATKITTAVVAENGTERHVPTDVYYENGVWYARINSLTNSVYALIYTKKRIKNNGTVPQYYVEDDHEAIIPKELFMQVQEELVRRRVVHKSPSGRKRTYSCNHCFAQIIVCGECGELYRRIHWNNHGRKSIVWRCISRLEPTSAEKNCTNRTVNELLLQEITVKAFNQILTERDIFLKTLQQNIAKAVVSADTLSPGGIQARLEELQKELIKKANNKQDYDAIADEIFRLRDQKEQSELDTHHREEAMNRIKELQDFIAGQETDITEFDEALVKKLIEKITVFTEHFTVEFKSGITIDIEA